MRLLIKTSRQATSFRFDGGASRSTVALRPLMPNVDSARAQTLAAAPNQAWHVTEDVVSEADAWDKCHALMQNGLGIGPNDGVTFAEPDLEQSWLSNEEHHLGFAGTRSDDCSVTEPQRADYPEGPGDGWYRTAAYSGLADARSALGPGAPNIRLVHLDTGYDPNHQTKPVRLREDLALNFADPDTNGQPAPGAQDQKTAEINPMFGHGTATLALLAGEPYGGASGFEVVPFRVANWVVLFRNSAIAAALDHVLGFARDPAKRCDVLSMSMGGLPSAAWADAVNALYDAGIVLVTAAGNNYGNLPARTVVYPARFNRVLAAAGVMADRSPYADLGPTRMAGCYGPDRKMRTALSAWTPNVPWACFGCPDRVDQNGGGTSAATPQIAAAAALWLQRHGRSYEGWQRVEAVRDALFRSAHRTGDAIDSRLGRGTLQAAAALALAPSPAGSLRQEAEDSTSFALLRLLTGLGAASQPGMAMLELEALQISQRSDAVLRALAGRDPNDANVAAGPWENVLRAVAHDPACSRTLHDFITEKLGDPKPLATPKRPADAPAATGPREGPPPSVPAARRIRIFSFDPSFGSNVQTRTFSEATVEVDWERSLQPGPVGEYVEVVDIDPASQRAYAPISLNLPEILAENGLHPSEGSPQFHQQMVYAVAMRTIGFFRDALGRDPLWAERMVKAGDNTWPRTFVRRLRIYPHALREPNAYYSPDRHALLFGYFRAVNPGTTDVMKGGMIFTCLSHDVVAHETTHALLDGLHPRWKEFTNPDAPAFHEAFADIVALFQHFTMPDALLAAIQQARGDLRLGGIMAQMARQFGQAIGGRGALRSALGSTPKPTDYTDAKEPHARGQILVAAIFDAWLQVYEDRVADLKRLATGGTGVLPPGTISADLAFRLCEEAAKLAKHFLNMCIRALDYCAPVDPTFGEYLRALITADRDLVRNDTRGYRVALVDGFRKRGILPPDVQTWSPEALVWDRPERNADLGPMKDRLKEMAGNWRLDGDRLLAWQSSRRDAAALHALLVQPAHQKLREALGLLEPNQQTTVDGVSGTPHGIEVHSVRPLRRVGPDGQVLSAVVIEFAQRWDPDGGMPVRGGATVIYDRAKEETRYVIRKRVGHAGRAASQNAYRFYLASDGARGNYFSGGPLENEPFAMLHTCH